jgi:NADPH:quinone reductase-like Zn-dependent oxidoreductase
MFFAMPAHARWVNYGKLSTDAPALTQLGQLIFQGKQIEGFWLTRWMKQVDPARIPAAFVEIQERFVSGAWKTDVAGIVPLGEVMTKLPQVLALPDGKAFIDPR